MLFLVKHHHDAEKCPAKDPQMGNWLLKHISPENAKKFGLQIQAEAVVNGGHALYLIVDSRSDEPIKQFMEPFSHVGSVEILPASHCEEVVSRGQC